MELIKTLNSSVEIGKLEKSSLSSLIDKYTNIFILVDENTKVNLSKISFALKQKDVKFIEIKSGEKEKNIVTCQLIWSELIKLNANRNSLLINFGGGVITDMGGFIASTFKRGIDFINIPTSLLSMVDASIGGKTGINFENLKNNLGVFIEPKAVFCDVSLLNTLPKRELVSGIGEILKHALITDLNYWNSLTETNYSNWDWNKTVSQSIRIKNSIVTVDPLEKSERKKLNFGHTIGHAIESNQLQNNIDILHGEAVAIGIICESYLSYTEHKLQKNKLEDIVTRVKSIFELPTITKDNQALLSLMLQDKKNEIAKINFTLLDKIGSSSINHYINESSIIESLDFYRNLN